MTFTQRTQLRAISRRLNEISHEISQIQDESDADLIEARKSAQKASFLCVDACLADEAKGKVA